MDAEKELKIRIEVRDLCNPIDTDRGMSENTAEEMALRFYDKAKKEVLDDLDDAINKIRLKRTGQQEMSMIARDLRQHHTPTVRVSKEKLLGSPKGKPAEEDKSKDEIINLAIQSVKQFKLADDENDKWRERHEHWKELDKIITDKEHLEVEALYDKASDMMDEVINLWERKRGL